MRSILSGITIAVVTVIGWPSAQAAGQTSQDTHCVDERFLPVPGGPFIEGSDRDEREVGYVISGEGAARSAEDIPRITQRLRDRRWFEWEEPRGTASVEPLCLQRKPVTNAEYLAFVLDTGHRIPHISAADYQQQGFLHHPYSRAQTYLWRDGQPPSGELDHPVVLVSYTDALSYARWLGERDGVRYRLPTRQEWEKAARGTDGRYFPWGDTWRDDATNWAQSGYRSSPVGGYEASRGPYGHDDMAGNVFEWTATLRQPENAVARSVLKGCSWDDLPGFCRGAYQHTRPIHSRHILFGFRLAHDVGP